MPVNEDLPRFPWLRELGLSDADLRDLNPCVPGEFTLPNGLYINTATPGQVYRGTEEGTLPMISGRWFSIPQDIAGRFPALGKAPARVAAAVRLSREVAISPDAPVRTSEG